MTARTAYGRIRPGGALVVAFAYAVIAFLVLPVLLVVPMSFSDTAYLSFPPQGFTLKWYVEIFTEPMWIRPTLFSLEIALLVSALSSVLGTAAALALVRGRFRGKTAVRLLIISPIIAPNVVVAIAMFFAFVEVGLIGNLGAFVMGHSVLSIPFVMLTVSAALHRFDPDLELAAMNLGANRWTAFRRVTLPIIMPGVASGAIFSFIISFDEPVISYFVSSVRQATLPRIMFQNIETSVQPNVAAISTVLMLLSVLLLSLAWLLRRGQAQRLSETSP